MKEQLLQDQPIKEVSRFPLTGKEEKELHKLLEKIAQQWSHFTCDLGYGRLELYAIMPPSEYYKSIE